MSLPAFYKTAGNIEKVRLISGLVTVAFDTAKLTYFLLQRNIFVRK